MPYFGAGRLEVSFLETTSERITWTNLGFEARENHTTKRNLFMKSTDNYEYSTGHKVLDG